MNQRPHQRPQMMHPQRPRISPQLSMYSPQQHLLSSPRAFTPRMTRTKTRTRPIRGLDGASRGALLQNSYPGQSNIQAAGFNQLPNYASGQNFFIYSLFILLKSLLTFNVLSCWPCYISESGILHI